MAMNGRELVHKWAHQTKPASNRYGSIRFEGPALYSYAACVARIYEHKTRGRFVLLSERGYSNTTRKRLSHAHGAVSHLPAASVPHVSCGLYSAEPATPAQHRENFEFLIARAADELVKAQRAMGLRSVAWRRDVARGILNLAREYAAFFGIRRKVPDFPEIAWDSAALRAERIENPDPASADKRERQRAQRIQRKREREARAAAERRARDFWRIGAARTSWRLGDAWGHDYEALRSSPCALRLNAAGHVSYNDGKTAPTIETSWGACVPLAAAPMVWTMVQRARAGLATVTRGAGFSRARIGDYPLDRIDADGTLHAGCHTIPFSELAAMARALKLEGAQ